MMKVRNKAVFQAARGPGKCRHCGRTVPIRHAAHIIGRGAGGPDVSLNVLPLCAPCHLEGNHAGREPTHATLLAYSAADHGMLQAEVEDRIRRMIRAPKGCTVCPGCDGKGVFPAICAVTLARHSIPCPCCTGTGIIAPDDSPYIEPPRTHTWDTN